MRLDRRQFLATSGFVLTASCSTSGQPDTTPDGTAAPAPGRLDRALAGNSGVLPENGGGANHYPMAAEVLDSLGRDDAIADSWIDGSTIYSRELPRVADIADPEPAFGDFARYGDWLDFFRAELARSPWRTVVRHWSSRLAPAIVAATFHGILRTAHAVRALRRSDSAERRDELAAGLAYWAARHVVLPAAATDPHAGASLGETLARVDYPWQHDPNDPDFDAVLDRLTAAPIAPPMTPSNADPRAELAEIVTASAAGFLEMLVLERNRIWLLHTVTGPAAIEMLLPELDEPTARQLVAAARQAVIALWTAYGAPFDARAHVRTSPPQWPELVEQAVASGSVHGVKLIDALRRFDDGTDLLWRSVAAQWFEWV